MKLYLLIASCCLISILFGCKKSTLDNKTTTIVPEYAKKQLTVIMISADGFRPDYLNLSQASDLKKFSEEGVKADGMVPSFPSSTFANHYTLATGLYPENHGIVDQRFYDRTLSESFNGKKSKESKWFFGSPLWTLAANNNTLYHSSWWFGSEANGTSNQVIPYDNTKDKDESNPGALDERIGKIIADLKKPIETRPNLITFYMSNVDVAAHKNGPNATETTNAVKKANDAVKKLVDEVSKLNLPNVNYVFVSDHGMVEADMQTPIPCPTITSVSKNKFVMTTDETMIQIYAKDAGTRETDIANIYNELKVARDAATADKDHYSVVLKKDNTLFATGSKDLHNRIGDILLIAKSPYQFQLKDSEGLKALKKGCHGYDPKNNPAMNATFFAWGSAFNKTTIPSFKNVDVYPLVAHTLGLKYTHPIDGNKNTLVNAKVLKSIK